MLKIRFETIGTKAVFMHCLYDTQFFICRKFQSKRKNIGQQMLS